MKKTIIIIIISLLFCSCTSLNPARMKKYVHFETNKGEFVIGLYEGTPKHKKNFIKQCNSNVYDSCIVYYAKPNTVLKIGLTTSRQEELFLKQNYSNGKTIPAEINKKLINKRAAIGMLHWDNSLNKDIQSDEKLFYIVEGQKYSEQLIQKYEMFQNGNYIKEYIYNDFLERPENQKIKDSLFFLEKHRRMVDYSKFYTKIADSVVATEAKKINSFSFSEKESKIYSEVGGDPELNGKYTVFGEIVWNQDIVNKIATKALEQNFKPRNNIYFFNSKVMNKQQFKKFLKKKISKN